MSFLRGDSGLCAEQARVRDWSPALLLPIPGLRREAFRSCEISDKPRKGAHAWWGESYRGSLEACRFEETLNLTIISFFHLSRFACSRCIGLEPSPVLSNRVLRQLYHKLCFHGAHITHIDGRRTRGLTRWVWRTLWGVSSVYNSQVKKSSRATRFDPNRH